MRVNHLKYLLIFLSLNCFASNITNANNYKFARPDTIDYWILRLDGKELRPSGKFKERLYVLENVSINNKFEIRYYTDRPCPSCSCKMEFRDEKGAVVLTMNRIGNTSFQLSNEEFQKLLSVNGRIYIFFSGRESETWGNWRLLGVVTKTYIDK